MRKELIKMFPELFWIKDEKLRESTINAYIDALTVGGWNPIDMHKIPFTLDIPNTPISYFLHIKSIIKMCDDVWKDFGEVYNGEDAPNLDYDTLIAGAFLHDLGKLVEYTEIQDGCMEKSTLGRDLRHPFSGTVIAMRNGIPSRIAHIIATHGGEGDGTLRSPEAVVLNKIDWLNYQVFRSHKGLI